MNAEHSISVRHKAGLRLPPGLSLTDRRRHAFLIGIIVALSIIDAIWLPFSTVKLDVPSLLWQLPQQILFIGLFVIYGTLRPAPRIAITCLAIAEISLFALPATIFSYLAMRLGRPLVDDLLASWDRALYFNWPAYVGFVLHRPWLAFTLYALYASSVTQIAIVSLILGFSARYQELTSLMAVLMISGCITIICGAVLPALGGYYHFGIPDYGITSFVSDIQGSLNGTLRVITFDHVEGLVMFPSYHTVISLALIAVSWNHRYLRYPIIIINIALLASIPVFGGHYLMDILAGAGLTELTLLIWHRSAHRRNHVGSEPDRSQVGRT